MSRPVSLSHTSHANHKKRARRRGEIPQNLATLSGEALGVRSPGPLPKPPLTHLKHPLAMKMLTRQVLHFQTTTRFTSTRRGQSECIFRHE